MTRARSLVAAMAVSGLLIASLAGPAAAGKAQDFEALNNDADAVTAQANPLELLIAEARAGNAMAMNVLGVAYVTGVQFPLDYAIAVSWFQKAIDAGSADAMSNLAILYLRGVGLPRDPANAFRWFVRAAANGHARSVYTAAVMADQGLGTSPDPVFAQALFKRAAQTGFAPAMLKVSDDAARSGADTDLVEAYAWLQLASQSDVPEALQIEVLAKLDRIEARLGPDARESARLRAVELAGIVKRLPAVDAAGSRVSSARSRTLSPAHPGT